LNTTIIDKINAHVGAAKRKKRLMYLSRLVGRMRSLRPTNGAATPGVIFSRHKNRLKKKQTVSYLTQTVSFGALRHTPHSTDRPSRRGPSSAILAAPRDGLPTMRHDPIDEHFVILGGLLFFLVMAIFAALGMQP
jgi:hypothetical protein